MMHSRDLGAVSKAIEHRYDLDVFRRIIYTESHDEVANGRSRVPEEIWPGKVDSWFSKKRSTLGGALVLTSPGIPMIFEGQELLEDRWFQDKDPIDWSRAEEEHGILGMYRDLIALRRNRSGVTRGLCGQNIHIYHFDDGAKLIAFHRWDKQGPTDSVVVVVNMTNQNRDGYASVFRGPDCGKRALTVTPTTTAQTFTIILLLTSKLMRKEPMDCPAPAKSVSGHTQW